MDERTVDDLSDAELATLQRSLVDLREQLAAELEEAKASSQPVALDQTAVGRLSRMDSIQQQHMALAHRQRLQGRLEQTKAALVAVTNGDFGYCKICEEPQTYRRLKVRPESPICVSCQSKRE